VSAYPPSTTNVADGSGIAESTVGVLVTTKATWQGNALGVYVRNNDAVQTVTFALEFKPAPLLDWVVLPALNFTDVAAETSVYEVIPFSIPVSGPLSLRLKADASGAGNVAVDYRLDMMERR